MPYPKRQIEGELSIDGVKFTWHLLRDQQWCTADGWQGPAVVVSMTDGKYRPLVLQYPCKRLTKNLNLPEGQRWTTVDDKYRPLFRKARIEADIRKALSEGWDPTSRGKKFMLELDILP